MGEASKLDAAMVAARRLRRQLGLPRADDVRPPLVNARLDDAISRMDSLLSQLHDARADINWEESKHPRDKSGKFTSGPGAGKEPPQLDIPHPSSTTQQNIFKTVNDPDISLEKALEFLEKAKEHYGPETYSGTYAEKLKQQLEGFKEGEEAPPPPEELQPISTPGAQTGLTSIPKPPPFLMKAHWPAKMEKMQDAVADVLYGKTGADDAVALIKKLGTDKATPYANKLINHLGSSLGMSKDEIAAKWGGGASKTASTVIQPLAPMPVSGAPVKPSELPKPPNQVSGLQKELYKQALAGVKPNPSDWVTKENKEYAQQLLDAMEGKGAAKKIEIPKPGFTKSGKPNQFQKEIYQKALNGTEPNPANWNMPENKLYAQQVLDAMQGKEPSHPPKQTSGEPGTSAGPDMTLPPGMPAPKNDTEKSMIAEFNDPHTTLQQKANYIGQTWNLQSNTDYAKLLLQHIAQKAGLKTETGATIQDTPLTPTNDAQKDMVGIYYNTGLTLHEKLAKLDPAQYFSSPNKEYAQKLSNLLSGKGKQTQAHEKHLTLVARRLKRHEERAAKSKSYNSVASEGAAKSIPTLDNNAWWHNDAKVSWEAKTALSNYKGAGYHTINGILRGAGYTPEKHNVEQIALIDELFEEPECIVQEDTIVRRGENVPSEVLEMMKQSLEAGLPCRYMKTGFVSASVAAEPAFSHKKCWMHITCVKGSKVMGVNNRSENEVLLRHGQNFDVWKMENKPYGGEMKTHIYMTVIV